MTAWLLDHNGTSDIFPVPDAREPRTLTGNLLDERQGFFDFALDCGAQQDSVSHLLPIAHVGNGDYYCLDLSDPGVDDVPVVIWSHETLEAERRADSFTVFLAVWDELDD